MDVTESIKKQLESVPMERTQVGTRGGVLMVALFCERLPQLVEGNIPFHKGNE